MVENLYIHIFPSFILPYYHYFVFRVRDSCPLVCLSAPPHLKMS